MTHNSLDTFAIVQFPRSSPVLNVTRTELEDRMSNSQWSQAESPREGFKNYGSTMDRPFHGN